MFNPPTVKELIERLQTLPPDLKVYLRSKYTGSTIYSEDYPVNINGVCEMRPANEDKNVTFLF